MSRLKQGLKSLVHYSKVFDTDSHNLHLPRFKHFRLDEQTAGWTGWSGPEGSG